MTAGSVRLEPAKPMKPWYRRVVERIRFWFGGPPSPPGVVVAFERAARRA